jgi:hypothetical protein
MQEESPKNPLKRSETENARQEAKVTRFCSHLKSEGSDLQALGRLEESGYLLVFCLKISYKLLSEDPGNVLIKTSVLTQQYGNLGKYFSRDWQLYLSNNAMRPD